jgi:transcriptional regulator with GAF, ATPase, and Fis domain
VSRNVPTDASTEALPRRNQAQLSTIIDSAADAIIIVDESQRIQIINRAAEKIFASPHADAIGQLLEQFIPPKVVDELYSQRAMGEEFPMEASISLVEVGGEKLFTLILRDITRRREAERALQQALEELAQLKHRLEEENLYLQQELQLDHASGEIVGHSDAIKYVLAKIRQVAPTNSTVLIQGETGTGKELVARAIHSASAQRDRPLIKVNCAALSATLIESELFGHEKGAFTGAAARKLGRFELADGGTIFLDEVGELPLDLQVKLLRVVQEGEFERVGGTRTIKVNVRLIAATNRDLKMEVDHGHFREDLWYRLNVFPITVPPLRQRREDLPLLVEHFVSKSAKRLGKTITSISGRAMQSLEQHSWPGNVRELANVIERAVIGAHGPVLDFVERFELVKADSTPPMSLHEMERDYIARTLESTGWRVEGPYGAAKILGLNASTLRARMHKLGIERHPPRSMKPQNFTSPLSNTDSAKY